MFWPLSGTSQPNLMSREVGRSLQSTIPGPFPHGRAKLTLTAYTSASKVNVSQDLVFDATPPAAPAVREVDRSRPHEDIDCQASTSAIYFRWEEAKEDLTKVTEYHFAVKSDDRARGPGDHVFENLGLSRHFVYRGVLIQGALYWGCVRAYNEVGDFNETCSDGVRICNSTLLKAEVDFARFRLLQSLVLWILFRLRPSSTSFYAIQTMRRALR